MKISELSTRTGVPAATLKFYVREGLLPGGDRRSATQVSYADEHVRRVRLIRALTQTAGLSVADARDLLDELDDPDPRTVMRHAQQATIRAVDAEADEHVPRAQQVVRDLLRSEGLPKADKPSAARDNLVTLVATLLRLGHPELIDLLPAWTAAAKGAAEAEISALANTSGEELAERVIIGTVLGGEILAALRLLAQAEASEPRPRRRP